MASLSLWNSCGCVHGPKKPSLRFTPKELYLQQRRQLELLKDDDISILYHPSKVNVLDDGLSRLLMGSSNYVEEGMKEFNKKVHRLARLGVQLCNTPYPK